MAIITADDVKTRLISNKQIVDDNARAADFDTLKDDIEETWGTGKTDAVVCRALEEMRAGI